MKLKWFFLPDVQDVFSLVSVVYLMTDAVKLLSDVKEFFSFALNDV